MSKTKRIVWGVFIAVILVGVVFAGMFARRMTTNTGVSARQWWTIVRNPRGYFPADRDRLNILLIGKDYSYLRTKSDPTLNGARYTADSRSDTIMMLSLDMKSQRVSVLSIPRDTRVTAPDGKTGKINATYKRGGVRLLSETVSRVLGVSPDYYVAVKPEAVEKLVDILGGVEVETIDAMEYHDAGAGLHINLPKGRQKINGDQAVGFARFREADIYARNPDGSGVYTGRKDSAGNPIFRLRPRVHHSEEEGDGRRTARQQQLIRAMAAQAKQSQNWLKADQIIATAYGEIETSLTHAQLFALAALFRNMKPDQVQSATLEGKGTTHGTYFLDLDERKTRAMVEWLLKGDEDAANRLTVVAVKNGTAVKGAARQAAAVLAREGFDANVLGGGGAAGAAEIDRTRILYGAAAVEKRARRIAALLGGGTLTKTPKEQMGETDVTVVLGRDLAPTFAASSAARREARLP